MDSLSSIEKEKETDDHDDVDNDEIQIVFSDLDGTLIHYPKKLPTATSTSSTTTAAITTSPDRNNDADDNKKPQLLQLPPSSTGMRGVISSKTLALVQSIRQRGVKVVLISGMRTPTLLSRIPYLPRADAYCTEAGGRIFYPTAGSGAMNAADSSDKKKKKKPEVVVQPVPYEGCASDWDLQPFGLVEDEEWRERMEETTGPFVSSLKSSLSSLITKKSSNKKNDMDILEERQGLLWDFARQLIAKGYVLDLRGYSACFRVNQKQQRQRNNGKRKNEEEEEEDAVVVDFQALIDGRIPPLPGLATSVNLSCVDYYPAASGKRNW